MATKDESAEIVKVDDATPITYTAGGIDVTLTNDIIRDYVCNGRKDVSDGEIAKFGFMCQARRLNPFVDVIPTVYGSGSDARISIVVTKDYYLRTAQRNPKFRGINAGVTVMSSDGTRIERRKGSMVMPGEYLVGGWAEAYVDGWQIPSYAEVSMEEYDQGQSLWKSKPATMIRKVAEVQALREAFPEDFGWVYDQSEMPETGNYEKEE